MPKGDVVKAKNRADTKTEIPRGVLCADAGYILSNLQRAAA
jgi:hypothetical protein